MSTTYFMVVNEKDVEIARTHFNGEQVELTWVNPLADLLVDEEVLMSDSGNQLYETVGDLRALEVPSDAEVIVKLREELVAVKEEAFEARCSADHLEDELADLSQELLELEGDLEAEIDNSVLLGKDIEEFEERIRGLVVDKDDVANTNMHSEDELVEKINELKLQNLALKIELTDMDSLENKLIESEEYVDELKEDLSHTCQVRDMLREDVAELEMERENAKSFTDDLKQGRKELSDALQDSFDREAELRKEVRQLKRDVLTMNDVVDMSDNFNVTIFGEERNDGQGGFFEHDRLGEEWSGGLWFGFDVGNSKYLRDFDGVHFLPPEVADVLRANGILVDDANV